jgi:uncharacterized delta-60 repeat protein
VQLPHIDPLEPRRFFDAGLLDNQFNTTGAAVTDFRNVFEQGRAVLPMADGRVVVVGGYSLPANTSNDWDGFVLIRHNADGTFDPTFGAGGAVRARGPAGLDIDVTDAVMAPDGSIIVVGHGVREGVSPADQVGLVVTRFTAAGEIDTSFATGGILETDLLDLRNTSGAVALQSDGKILIGGMLYDNATNSTRLGVARLNANGAFDNTFDGDGRAFTPAQQEFYTTNALLLNNDGSMIVVGQSNSADALVMAKFDSSGNPVNGFGTAGVAKFNDGWEEANNAALALDGGIVTVGTSGINGAFRISKFNATGQRVLNFGDDGTDDGKIDVAFSGPATANAVVLQSDGRLVVAGTRARFDVFPVDSKIALTRLNPDGTVDGTWGEFGKTAVNFARTAFDEGGGDLAIAADGTVYAVGTSAPMVNGQNSGKGRLAVARFWRAESPSAYMGPRRITRAGPISYTFSVVYRDDTQVNPATLNNPDIEITGPNGAIYKARFLGSVAELNGAVRIANYNFAAPGGSFGAEDNGVYTIRLRSNQVGDMEGNLTIGRTLGTIRVAIPVALPIEAAPTGRLFSLTRIGDAAEGELIA